MIEKELVRIWRELRRVWKSTSQTILINRGVAKEITVFKNRVSDFEKRSIVNDLKGINQSIKKFNP